MILDSEKLTFGDKKRVFGDKMDAKYNNWNG